MQSIRIRNELKGAQHTLGIEVNLYESQQRITSRHQYSYLYMQWID